MRHFLRVRQNDERRASTRIRYCGQLAVLQAAILRLTIYVHSEGGRWSALALRRKTLMRPRCFEVTTAEAPRLGTRDGDA